MDKRISQLELVTELDNNDVLPIVNDGITKKVKVSQLISSGGQTNLSYLPDPANGVIDNDNGTSATIPLSTSTDAGLFSPAEKTKLEGIEIGAQVNVNADWNAVSGDAEILNKPTIPDATSDLTNDSGFITIGDVPIPSLQQVTDNGFETTNPITAHQLVTRTNGGTKTMTLSSTNVDVERTAEWQNKDYTGIADITDIPDVSTLVPYTGANANVDLGEFELKAGQLTLDTTPTGTASVTTTRWNDTAGVSETTLKGGNVILKNGVDLVARIVNKVTSNTTLTKAEYQVVRISGVSGQRLSVELAQANNDTNSADTLGIVIETIPINQEGFIMTMGQLEDINTTGSLQGETWADGDVLYLSPTTAGAITNIKPTGATGHIVVLGYVEYSHVNNGKIYVKIMNGWELDELHNCFIDTPLNNQVLTYDSASSLWKNKVGQSLYNLTSQVTLTGTTAKTIIATYYIPANTFTDGDFLNFSAMVTKVANIAITTHTLEINTTNTLTGATIISTAGFNTSNFSMKFKREIALNGGNGYILNINASTTNDQTINATANGMSSFTYNLTADLYFFVTCTLQNATDSITYRGVSITKN